MPTYRQIETFIVLARVLNGNQAMRVLGIRTSTIRTNIENLEHNLGFAVFVHMDYSGRYPYTLTPAGKAFLPYAKQLLEVLRDGRRKAIQAMNEMEKAS